MSTNTLDPTMRMSPDRRAPSSLEPRITASSQRNPRTFVKIFLVSAAAAVVLPALLSIHIEMPSTKGGLCTSQNLPLRPYVSPLFGERAHPTYALPIPNVPTGTDWIAAVNCDHGLDDRNFDSQIHY
jgi:hypothetical protein